MEQAFFGNRSPKGHLQDNFHHVQPNLGYNKMVSTKPLHSSLIFIVLAVLIFSGTACSAEPPVPDTPTPTPLLFITATLPPTQTPRPSATPEPPTATVPVTPAEGQTISQLNVRSAPSAESDLLGTIQIATKVQIVGKDPTGAWWMIVYPEGSTSTGWVTAQFVQATNTENVPVFNGQTQGTGNAQGTNNDPVAGAGPTSEPGSVTAAPPASGLTLATAYQDGDSAQAPAVSVTLSKTSVHSFNFSSDISSPEGDAEDWVQFKINGEQGQPATVSAVFNCSGSGSLSVELIQNNSHLQSWDNMTCGHPNQLILSLFVGAPYYLRMSPSQANNLQTYINYTLMVTLQ
jgi:uncharacterized protein YgiM (DUF1202 family)